MNSEYQLSFKPLSMIGEGRRRQCFRLPGQDACVKFYRSASNLPRNARSGVRVEIALGRRFRALNINYREWLYHRSLKQRLPADLLAVFPEQTEPVFCPGRGWGIQETLILNADGSLPRRILQELTALDSPELARRICQESERLFERLAAHSVCFFDLSNVLVQWTGADTFRLRIADFEPSCRSFVPGLTHIRPYVSCKVRRRARRYLRRMKAVLAAKGLVCAPTNARPPVVTARPARAPFGLYQLIAQRVGLI